jgi:hypothetical protein
VKFGNSRPRGARQDQAGLAVRIRHAGKRHTGGLAQLARGAAAAVLAAAMLTAHAANPDTPRTPWGHPDLSGTYDVATLTPLQRPAEFGDNLFLTPEQAAAISEREAALMAAGLKPSDPDRDAPPLGGDGSEGAAGNVGGYNTFWIDRGDGAIVIDGKFRTSIIVDPPNGRLPQMTEAAMRAALQRRSQFRPNTGEAWWVDEDGPGPYDDPELRPLAERCLLGFGSTSGPPMLPVLYNNLKRVVQTPDHVVIVIEMNHDARIIRLDSEHAPPDLRFLMGDSIGWWEGDTLVVDTTNFTRESGLFGATESLHVVERFTRQPDGTLLYAFTVDDPAVWTRPWSGEYPWPPTGDLMYEYACHEANYALTNVLRGARLLEAEALEARKAQNGQ